MTVSKEKYKRCLQAGEPLLGAHLSIAKGLHHSLLDAAAHGCNVLQIFTKNANSWRERSLSADEVCRFETVRATTGIRVVIAHTSYLINLAGPGGQTQQLSLQALKAELARAARLSIDYVVLHPGSHKGIGESEGIQRVADSVNHIFADMHPLKSRLLFETTAGQGSNVGHCFEHLALLLERIENRAQTGICLDTSHVFAAGYDIRTKRTYRATMAVFDAVVGLGHLHLIHLNDSKKGLGSRIDRHEHIGRGEIGKKAFGFIMNDDALMHIPKIIETPKKEQGKDCDAFNLKCLRDMVSHRAKGAS